jgi:hypothetical protein
LAERTIPSLFDPRYNDDDDDDDDDEVEALDENDD